MDEQYQARLQDWRRDLHAYKSEINLAAFAAERYGYTLRRKESYRRVKVLKNEGMSHKIVVARDAKDGHWIYFSIETPDAGDRLRRGLDRRADSGTIVDFIRHREPGYGMRAIHAECRKWLGRPDLSQFADHYRVESSNAGERDRAKVALEYEAARLSGSSYYLQGRGIRPETLRDTRFADTWRLGRYGNVMFVHRDQAGISGYEIKNRNFTSFSPGGSKTLWRSQERPEDRVLVVTEAAIDALSYHQLHRAANARYVSFAGQPRDEQLELLRQNASALPAGSTAVLAFDNDDAGNKLAAIVGAAVEGIPIERRRHAPATVGLDWNNVVQQREQAYIRAIAAGRQRHTPQISLGRDR